MGKKSASLVRSVLGLVLSSLLLLTLFMGRASAGTTEELLEGAGKAEPEKVRQLIQGGADVNAKNKDGLTPLMLAAQNNPNPEVLKVLIKAGEDVNAKDTEGWTPLMIAAIENTPEVLTALLEAGADAKAKNNEGKTALDCARMNEKLKGSQALKLLTEKAER